MGNPAVISETTDSAETQRVAEKRQIGRSLKPFQELISYLLLAGALATVAFTLYSRTMERHTLSYDAVSMYQAGINLANGKGLVTEQAMHSHRIEASAVSQVPLTWHPPGYSLIVAVLTAFESYPETGMRIVYLVVTLLGIGFWISLVWRYTRSRDLQIHQRLLILALFAVFLKTTIPPWKGNDLFLWAGSPLSLLVLLRGTGTSAQNFSMFGLVGGMFLTARYQSYFLLLAGFVHLAILGKLLSIRERCARACAMIGGFLVGSAPLFLYLQLNSNRFVPQYVRTPFRSFDALLERAWFTLRSIGTTLWGNVPETFGRWLSELSSTEQGLMGVAYLSCLAGMLYFVYFNIRSCDADRAKRLIFLSAFMSAVAAMTLFLSLSMFGQQYNLIGQTRYYLSVLAIWAIIGSCVVPNRFILPLGLALSLYFIPSSLEKDFTEAKKRSAQGGHFWENSRPTLPECNSSLITEEILDRPGSVFYMLLPCPPYGRNNVFLTGFLSSLDKNKTQLETVKIDMEVFVEVDKNCDFLCIFDRNSMIGLVKRPINMLNHLKGYSEVYSVNDTLRLYRFSLKAGMTY